MCDTRSSFFYDGVVVLARKGHHEEDINTKFILDYTVLAVKAVHVKRCLFG
jgi:hypothetical protein